MKKLRTSYAKPGLLMKVKKINRTSSEKSRVKEKPKKLAWTSSETFRDPCWRCSASRGYVEKCEMSNGLGPPKGRCWVSLFSKLKWLVWLRHAALWREYSFYRKLLRRRGERRRRCQSVYNNNYY